MIVALDLDGTLITAQPRQMCLLKAVAAGYGVHLDTQHIWNQKSAGATNRQALLASGVAADKAEAICRGWLRDIESAYWLTLDTPFMGALEALAALRLREFELVLVTARQNEYLMRQQIDRLGIFRLFDQVHCVSPARTVWEKSNILNALKPQAFFGDTETDFQAARTAGIPFYGLSTGQRSRDFLLAEGVEHVADSLHSSIEHFLARRAQQQLPGLP